ncbi:MAG: tetratricopeptide repeat protein [Planctomycetaceae bacterium]|nr:tetratricopeptide repeat protein [Planctomycetaceae bacterium]
MNQSVDFHDDTERGEVPGLREWLSPRLLIGWTFRWLEGWLVTRSYRSLAAGTLFLLLVFGGAGLLLWARSAPPEDVITVYETGVSTALKNKDAEAAQLYLTSLVRMRPATPEYRFRLALLLLDQDKTGEALFYMAQLTGDGPTGYIPARLWLVHQAQMTEPLIRLTDEQTEQQLRLVLASAPQNPDAARMMAELCLRRGQLKSAEDYLITAVETHPQLGLPLAKVQRLLKRSEEQIAGHLQSASESYRTQVLTQPTNAEARVRYAESLLLQELPEDAERVLNEGRALARNSVTETTADNQQAEPPTDDSNTDASNPSDHQSSLQKLNAALADLYSGTAARRLRESALNRDLAANLVAKAIAVHPDDDRLLQQALALTLLGCTWDAAELAPAIQSLHAAPQRAPEQTLLLAQALSVIGSTGESVEILSPLITDHPELRLAFARLLNADHQTAKANKILDELITEFTSSENTDDNSDRILEYAEALLLRQRPESAVETLTALSQRQHNVPAKSVDGARSNDSGSNAVPLSENDLHRTQLLLGRAYLMVFDQQLADESFASGSAAVQLLREALKTDTVTLPVLERLVRLPSRNPAFAVEADRALAQILAAGTANAAVYNLIGTQALKSNDTERARRYLERAWSLDRTNPMILNNLAIALVRSADDHADRALELANEALAILPEHPDVLSTRAEIYMAQKRWEDARRDLEISLPRRPESRNSRKLLAKVYDELDEPALAEEHRRLLSNSPE